MIAYNQTRNEVIANKVRRASNFFARMKGLLGTKTLASDEGLLIPKCQGIHTFGMAYAIDVVYLDKQNRILFIKENILPNKVGPTLMNAAGVLELPAGKAHDAHIQKGDTLSFQNTGDNRPGL